MDSEPPAANMEVMGRSRRLVGGPGQPISLYSRGERDGMSIENHISALERKHQDIEREIATEERRPGLDDLHIAELKKRKLAIKDEIQRCAANSRQD